MLPVYLALVCIAAALSVVAMVPAIIVASIASVLVLRYELLWALRRAAAIKVPRPRLGTTTVKVTVPAEDVG